MKILVTGGAGFIGSHVGEVYRKAGHGVVVVDDLSSGKRKNLPSGVRLVKADVQDLALSRLFKKERFDVVCHHAAQMDVRRSVADPSLDARVNVLGFINILEQCRVFGVKKVIFAASGGTYYGETARPAREDVLPCPLSPYGVTKLTGEYYLRAYRALHGLSYTVLRYGNVFGPRQDPHGEAGVVAIFCRRLLAGETVTIYGDGKQKRDYVYVGDVARANLAALERGTDKSINIGTGRATSVNELFRVLSTIRKGKAQKVYAPARAGELFQSVLNPGLAQRELGWKAEVSLKEGLERTYRFIEGKI